jgi:uncharacterized membrane protein YvbJ
MKICPYCDQENKNKERWCCNCGRPIQDIKVLNERHDPEKIDDWQNNLQEVKGEHG